MVAHRQFVRFVIVGLSSNLLMYIVYLLLTESGVGHKKAMSLLYLSGVCLTFVFNRKWTFSYSGALKKSFLLYFTIYVLGYLVNYAALYFFVDNLGFSHRVVQGIMIFVIAFVLFYMQKKLVFTKKISGANIKNTAGTEE